MEAFTKAKAQQELKLKQDSKGNKRGFLKYTSSAKRYDPAPQGPSDLVTQDMEKAEVLNVLFCHLFLLMRSSLRY